MSLFRGRGTHIAVAQMRVEPSDPAANFTTAAKMIGTARARGASLVCLPATFATGLNFPTIRRDATPADGPVTGFLAEQAVGNDVHLAAGVLVSEGDDIYDAAVLVDPAGQALQWYRRRCLWEGETDFIAQGSPGTVIDTSLGRIGLLVSYDARFPEACRGYFRQDADIIVCVANLFAQYSFPLRSICRARAADNECCFVLASGLGENRLAMMRYVGRSMIVDGLVLDAGTDEDNDILADAGNGASETVIDAVIHPRQQQQERKKLPFHGDYVRMCPGSAGEGRAWAW